ncbi:MAG: FmdB family zinc ribbon protein [Phycisphaerales bacterium]
MPTYEYACRACKHEFEAFQSMSEGPKRKCPSCGKNTLERKIGIGAAILFKGSGFYQTDYRSESYKKSAEADSSPAGEPKADATPKPATDAKPSPEAKPAEPAPSAPKSTKVSSSRPSKPRRKAKR